jgi:hypothetical protein
MRLTSEGEGEGAFLALAGTAANVSAAAGTFRATITADGSVTRAGAVSVFRYRTKVTLRVLGLLFLMADGVVTLVDPRVRTYAVLGMPAWFGFLYGVVFLVCPLVFAVSAVFDPHLILGVRPAGIEEREAGTSALTEGLTTLAVLLAGRRRAHVGEAWQSDLERPHDLAEDDLPAFRKVAYAAGLVKAGVRYRVDDAAVLWWRLADGVLASRFWSRLVLVSPSATAVVVILHRSGLYGLVSNAGNLVAIGTASAGLVYGGRKARKVTPKPAQQKQDQT